MKDDVAYKKTFICSNTAFALGLGLHLDNVQCKRFNRQIFFK
jgi:hypothetical protein